MPLYFLKKCPMRGSQTIAKQMVKLWSGDYIDERSNVQYNENSNFNIKFQTQTLCISRVSLTHSNPPGGDAEFTPETHFCPCLNHAIGMHVPCPRANRDKIFCVVFHHR